MPKGQGGGRCRRGAGSATAREFHGVVLEVLFGLAKGIPEYGFRQVAMLGKARIVGLGESAGMFLKQTIDALRVVIQHNLIEGDCREDGIVGRYDDPKT
ncbi:MAG: hypothetical protein KDA57_21375 [Planctomycetales bacterium]|nr:hypothetical protein [Planctomycetales bacterium]